MFKNKLVGVIVPAHNEEQFIATVIDTMPDFVDKIYVTNDASTDKTLEIISDISQQNHKLVIINRTIRGGVGASILTGHCKAIKDGMEILAVMAGDGQMAPEILNRIIDPIAEKKADYVKGNRLTSRQNRKEMPIFRTVGNLLLTTLTRIASGYWNISDPQNGYTAISAETLQKLDFGKIEPGFAFENDMLVKLNVIGARVLDVHHPAVYRGQHSKIKYSRFIIRTSWILFKDYFWRIWCKYSRRKISGYKNEVTV